MILSYPSLGPRPSNDSRTKEGLFDMSLEWFDYTEPSRTSSSQGELASQYEGDTHSHVTNSRMSIYSSDSNRNDTQLPAGKQSTSLRIPNKGADKACAYARLQRGAKLTNTARHTRFVCTINPRIIEQSKQEQLTSPPPLKFWSLLSNMMRARANRNMIVP